MCSWFSPSAVIVVVIIAVIIISTKTRLDLLPARPPTPLRPLVGGAIFSFLPIGAARHRDAFALFETPHETHFEGLCESLGLVYRRASTPQEFRRAYVESQEGLYRVGASPDSDSPSGYARSPRGCATSRRSSSDDSARNEEGVVLLQGMQHYEGIGG